MTRTTQTRLRHTAATLSAHEGAQPSGLLVLERYRLHRPLGAGGFGTVWMARDERLERDVAVKVLARDRVVGGRFEREARAAARLSHPGIVTLYEAAVDDDAAYLVSEFVRGPTLAQLLEAGRLSDRDIVEIGIALCEALAHAHAQGVVHRDVKPSNVLVPEAPGGGAQVAKLTDFGVARIIGADTLTQTGDVVGTAAYMAPEQAEGQDAGAPADLYSLALVLYEALTGVNPIALGLPAQRARKLGAHLPPLRRQRRDLPGDLGQGLDEALRPRPRERGSLDDLRSRLIAALPRVADQPGVVEPPWPAKRLLTAAQGPLTAAQRPQTEAQGQAARLRRDEPAQIDAPDALPGLRWPQRALAGAAAGLVGAWLGTVPSASPPLAPLATGVLAAVLVMALPRIGWLVLVMAGAGWLAAAALPGAALVVISAGLVPVLLMPRRRTSWPLAATAPLLGLVGLAGAWPAVAGRAPGLWHRAALGAVGWFWVLAAATVGGRAFYLRLPQTSGHLMPHLFNPSLLAPAAVWGLAATLVPWLRRRSLPLGLVLTSAWAGGLASGTVAALHLKGAGWNPPGGIVILGALSSWIVVLAPGLLRRDVLSPRSPDSAARLA